MQTDVHVVNNKITCISMVKRMLASLLIAMQFCYMYLIWVYFKTIGKVLYRQEILGKEADLVYDFLSKLLGE